MPSSALMEPMTRAFVRRGNFFRRVWSEAKPR